jgi:allantoate deiminase
VLLTGSHVDTVPDAGRFDGVLGVAIALAAVRALGRRRLRFAIEVIAFSEEEGIRFRLPYLGSRALVRTLGVQELARVDEAGVSVAEAIDRFRLNVEELGAAAITAGTFAFLEVHIEQGPVLEALGLPLGVVTGVAGQMQVEVIFRGRANHAGTTPMHLRHDALAAAAAWIGCVEALAKRTDGLVATVGTMRVSPGAANVVPGTAVVSVDVRHALDEVRRSAMRDLLAAAEREGGRRGVTVTARELSRQEAVRMEPGLVERIAAAVEEAGFPVHRMVSGAGHDAMILAKAVPAAMLFVRTPGGLSHHPDETVAAADVEAAIGVLLSVMERLESSTAEVSG